MKSLANRVFIPPMQKPEEIWREIEEEMERQKLGDSDIGKATGFGRDLTRKWREKPSMMPAYNKVMAVRSVLGLCAIDPQVPLLGRVPAGVPIRVDGKSLAECEHIHLPQAKPGWFAVIVEGDSMNLHAPEGYLLACNPIFDQAALDGRLVVANYNGQSTFKRYRSGRVPVLEPRSTNPVHSVIIPADGDELAIQAVVEFIVGDYREKAA